MNAELSNHQKEDHQLSSEENVESKSTDYSYGDSAIAVAIDSSEVSCKYKPSYIDTLPSSFLIL